MARALWMAGGALVVPQPGSDLVDQSSIRRNPECARKGAAVSSHRVRDCAGPWLGMLAALALSGCATVEYYAQSVTGHLGLMYQARPIETVIAAPETTPRIAARLRIALDIRDFASEVLGLPANASYRRFVDLGRRYVVWNVVAAPELSLDPRRWCFPVVGCLSYRGYFSESAAEEYAESLKSEGWDVTVAGVRAYSTLGWFDDPLLSSMVDLPEYFLAGIVFHEPRASAVLRSRRHRVQRIPCRGYRACRGRPMDRGGRSGLAARALSHRCRTPRRVPRTGARHEHGSRSHVRFLTLRCGEAGARRRNESVVCGRGMRSFGSNGPAARHTTPGSSAV